MRYSPRSWSTHLVTLLFAGLMPLAAVAQTPPAATTPEQSSQTPPPATTPEQSPQTPPPATAPEQSLLKAEQLDQLLAPIALYPDPLLSQVLIASTYPLEVVQADRWVKSNAKLKGDALAAAVGKQSWDDSVKSLAAVPTVLGMMSDQLEWTQKLGDAVLAQQPDVMDAVQRLRKRAHDYNKLKTTKEQKIVVTQVQNKQVIAIEPTLPETIYVPYYDPAVVYGAWPYPAYPPYYWPAPAYIGVGILATGLAFGAGWALARWTARGNYWGGGFNWGNNNININRPVNINNIGNNWQHNPSHRHGVKYNNANVQQRFGNNNIRGGNQARTDFRGRGGEQGLRPGGDRPGAGDRGPGDRPGAGDRGRGDGPGAGDRGRGDRAGARDGARGDRAGGVGQAKEGELQPAEVAAMPSGTCSQEGWPTCTPSADTPAWVASVAAAAVVSPPVAAASGAVALAAAASVVVVAAAFVAAAAASAAAGDPISRSSTTSTCSVASTTASGSIASATTAATEPMSA